MRIIRVLGVVVMLFALPYATAANLTITPTTTLAAETGNNSSAADTFVTLSDGNIGAGNVSKQPIRDLLYPGFSGQVYVNWVPWFGGSNHINIGYNSADIGEIDRQVADMMSRGVDGLIVDWWHSGSIETATTNMMYRAELNPPFKFALMYDASQLSGSSDPTQRLINDFNYATQHYYVSPAYLKIGGRPVMLEFGTELYPIDWTRVKAGITGNPLIIFRNAGGFTKPMTAGGFAWGASDTGTSYLDYFYSKALTYPTSLFTWGSAAKGFDDSLAAWTQHRFASQQCGQHWMTQLADASKYYASNPGGLDAMQIATWNDYEEGTEIESGIDNCVTISGTVTGTSLSWAITGMENTIHHYRVFISTDGINLMALSDVAAGTHGLDLSKFALTPGTYTLYVKAIGQASLRNQMSAGVSYSVGDHPPQATLSVTPGSGIAPVTVTASTAGSSDPDGTTVTSSLDFGDGTKAAGPVATHTYAAAGSYQITATVTDPQGLSATAAATVNVAANQPPLAALSLTPGSGVAPVTVTASTAGSSDPDGSVGSSQIDFGDGTIAAGPTAAHTYAAAGSYTVTAKVTDNLGATSAIGGTVSVTAAGVTVATPTTGSTSNSPVHVVASATSGNGISATWVYVDGVAMYKTNSAAVDASIPLSGGSHSMVVQAWDTKGTVLKAPVSLTVVAAPKVVMTSPVNGASVGSPVHVVASASSGAPVSAMWIYMDSNVVYKTALAKIDTYVPMPYGTHTITVKAWDATGALFKAAATVTR